MGLVRSGWRWREGPAGRAPGSEVVASGRAVASATMTTPWLHAVVQNGHLKPAAQSAWLLT